MPLDMDLQERTDEEPGRLLVLRMIAYDETGTETVLCSAKQYASSSASPQFTVVDNLNGLPLLPTT